MTLEHLLSAKIKKCSRKDEHVDKGLKSQREELPVAKSGSIGASKQMMTQ